MISLVRTGRFTMDKMKLAASRSMSKKGSHIFNFLLSGSVDKKNCTVYKRKLNFADVLLAVDKLSFNYVGPDNIFIDADLFAVLVRNEIARRKGMPHYRMKEFIPIYCEYSETDDVVRLDKMLDNIPLVIEY